MKRFLVRLTSFPGTGGVVASSEVTLATELVRDRAGFMARPQRETVGCGREREGGRGSGCDCVTNWAALIV